MKILNLNEGSFPIEIDLNLNTIVVLPINTLSSDESQLSLAAGLTQDISTSLSRSSKKLNVIKLNNTSDDLEKIASKSEARYIITGDLRSAADTLRVSVNLIDAETMKTAWSENFDRKSDIENIFQLQDDIVSNVIDALVGSGAILAKEVVKAAQDNNCSIRVGVNAGSLEKDILEKYREPCPEAVSYTHLTLPTKRIV